MKHCCRIHSFWHLRIEVIIRKHCITALVTKLVPPSSCSLISSRSVVHEGWLPFQWCLLLVYQQQSLWNWLELLVLVSVYLPLQYAGVFSNYLTLGHRSRNCLCPKELFHFLLNLVTPYQPANCVQFNCWTSLHVLASSRASLWKGVFWWCTMNSVGRPRFGCRSFCCLLWGFKCFC